MNTMKCPNCGSTAQFKLTSTGESMEHKYEYYKCGCGCVATRTLLKISTEYRTVDGTKLFTEIHYK